MMKEILKSDVNAGSNPVYSIFFLKNKKIDGMFKVFDELEHEDENDFFKSKESIMEFAAEEYGKYLYSDIEIPDRERVVKVTSPNSLVSKYKIRAELKIIVELD